MLLFLFALAAILLAVAIYFFRKSKNSAKPRPDFKSLLEDKILTYLPKNIPLPLRDSCAKALTGGKRIRAILLMETAWSTSVKYKTHFDIKKALLAAAAVEYIHAASIIIDDTPAFDNDSIRRNSPALHTEVGVFTTQLTAVILIATAIKNINSIDLTLCEDLPNTLSDMAIGQYNDMSDLHEKEEVINCMRDKTGSLFEFASIAGWLVARGPKAKLDEIRLMGKYLGLAFQIADDIDDAGKNDKNNFANLVGENDAVDKLEQYLILSFESAKKCDIWAPYWYDEIYTTIIAKKLKQTI